MVKGHRAGRVLDIEALEVPGVPLGWWGACTGYFLHYLHVFSHSEDDLFDNSDLTHRTSPPRTTPSVNHPHLRCYRDALPHALVVDPARREEGCRDALPLLPPPPTPETAAHVLAQGGAPPHTDTQAHPPSLLEDPHVFSSHSCNTSSPTSLASSSNSPPRPSHSYLHAASPPAASMPTAACASFALAAHTPGLHPTGLLAQMRSYLVSADFAVILETALDHATEVLIEGLRGRVFMDTAGE
ncbi:hypothetical protein BV22DRAFT_782416 [Leucogyrophana mollusca]|uniref:Uncharacterized protein n=1 Tax=Leucogyrophana mollusca TaxID=85980 RepID=A0ACB8B676_9AGAM|nr:hypothetical protein BV22DRAFT_782416 [Leucogyrophana mollusca]